MFENLTKKISSVFDKISFKKNITEDDLNKVIREIRIALLEADVSLSTIKTFIENVRQKAIGQKIIKSVSPAEQIIKITNDELTTLLGEKSEDLNISENKLNIILMCGLQGSGKTTTSGKLANFLIKKQKSVLLASTDIYRPAAKEQLEILSQKVGAQSLPIIKDEKVLDTVKRAIKQAKSSKADVLIIDTAGRNQLEETLMEEIKDIKKLANPSEIILTVDAMIGQEAINIAKAFNQSLSLTGLILTRIDGDARGGSALSIRFETDVAIKFLGTGEKIENLDPFYPDRIANRILGMGDVVSLVEKAQENIDEKEAKKMMDRMFSGNFDFNDMLNQINQMEKMGSIKGIMKFLPGASKIQDAMKEQGVNDNQVKKQKSIILSMTKKERANPSILLAGRKRRIAKGAGTSVSDVEKLIKHYEKTKSMMGQMQSMGGMKGMMKMVKDMQKQGDLPDMDMLKKIK